MTLPNQLFIPTKDRAGAANKDITIALRAIERWAGKSIVEITSNDGSVTVTNPTGPIVDLHVATGGGGGAYASLTGPGQTTTPGDLTQAGGLTVNTPAASTMGVQVNNASPQGIQLYNTATGTQGISIFDNAPAGSGTGVVITSAQKNVVINAGGLSGSTGQVILQSGLSGGGGSTNLIVDPNGIHIGTNNTTDVVSFFNGGGAGRQTVTGSRGGNAALASLLTALNFYGLILNSSTP